VPHRIIVLGNLGKSRKIVKDGILDWSKKE
jgi:hypothetical protein